MEYKELRRLQKNVDLRIRLPLAVTTIADEAGST